MDKDDKDRKGHTLCIGGILGTATFVSMTYVKATHVKVLLVRLPTGSTPLAKSKFVGSQRIYDSLSR
eukprot:scaffold3405_cov127-Cylindrotheca_fusiformis.AAC.3